MADTDKKGDKKNEADEPREVQQKEEESSADEEQADSSDAEKSEDKKPADTSDEKPLPEGRVKPPDDMDATAILPTKRTGYGESFFKTITYLSKISKDKSLSYRVSDKTTSNLLGLALIGAVIFTALPSMNLPSLALFCYIAADILLLVAIGGFVVTRFGIIRAMEPRYALVCWHLMVGASVLATTLVFNLVAIIVVYFNYDHFKVFLGG